MYGAECKKMRQVKVWNTTCGRPPRISFPDFSLPLGILGLGKSENRHNLAFPLGSQEMKYWGWFSKGCLIISLFLWARNFFLETVLKVMEEIWGTLPPGPWTSIRQQLYQTKGREALSHYSANKSNKQGNLSHLRLWLKAKIWYVFKGETSVT